MTALTLDLRSIKLTDEQFFLICQQNELILFERNADGTIVIMPLAGGITSIRNASLTAQIYTWNRDESLGIAFGSCTGFTLPNSAVRSPNASWLKRERWDALTQEQKEKIAPVCPDFVVELYSDAEDLKRLQNKMHEYLENGTRLGWLIDLETHKVEIYRQGQKVEVIENAVSLSGEEVLPGFVLNLESIWYQRYASS